MNDDRTKAILIVREWLNKKPIFLDTETTGLNGKSQVCELALVDHDVRNAWTFAEVG